MTEETTTKRQELTKRLRELDPLFPYIDRLRYCADNEIGLSTLYRYLTGDVSSLLVAGKLVDDIEKYLADKQ